MGATAGQRPDASVPTDDEDDPEPSPDDLFHVLRNRRRRYAIHHLKRAGEPVDVGDLATQVAAWENEVPVEAVTAQQRRRVYNALQQTHVPELEELGIVDVDRRDVALTDGADDLDIYLEVIADDDVPWSKYYIGLWGVGAALIAGTALNLPVVGSLPDVAAAVFLLVAVGVSAAAHHYDQRVNRVGTHERPPELRRE